MRQLESDRRQPTEFPQAARALPVESDSLLESIRGDALSQGVAEERARQVDIFMIRDSEQRRVFAFSCAKIVELAPLTSNLSHFSAVSPGDGVLPVSCLFLDYQILPFHLPKAYDATPDKD